MTTTGVRTMMTRSLMTGLVGCAFAVLAPGQAHAQQSYAGSGYGHAGWRDGEDRSRGRFDGRFEDRRQADRPRDRERFEPQRRDWDRGRGGDRFHNGHDRGYGYR